MDRKLVSFNDCEGNPGALNFMMSAYMQRKNVFETEEAFRRVISMGIKGDKLYILFNDCCGRDLEFAIDVMLNYPEEEILEAIKGNGCYGNPIKKKVSK